MTKAKLEQKFGIKIVDDGYWTFFGNYVRTYKIIAADGATWENGLGSIKAVEQECRKWEQQLLSIKAKKEAIR